MIKLKKLVYKEIQFLKRAILKRHFPTHGHLLVNMPAKPERGSKLHWPQKIPAKILIPAEGGTEAMDRGNKTEDAIECGVSYK